ncbi:zinc finger BED domain-containing protein 4-like [Temnothorax curvispinosus]|uniref:Zinc finger BED domain-containing protein 4-like n=1 Tax=Temnothorax curvispinosus TaxID=300111 RepID=A0A6J1QVQ1_9HYME|nr:zinc finger BED domain-containing protein 4-like [Temnothorax curvispinosus]XP_024886695.1 zinc finger BED domain-containing protein 4-like [Temnothorax curvispinosus]
MPRTRKNRIWRHFKKINENMAQCNLCTKFIVFSDLLRHMELHKNNATNRKDNEPKESQSMKRKRSIEHTYKFHRLKTNNADTETSAGAGTSYETKVEAISPPIQVSASPKVATFERISNYDDGDCQAQILDAILYFICADHRPLNIVQCKGFKYLIKKLVPLYKIPNKTAIKRRLDIKYDTVAQIFKQKLNEASHVTITLDTWSEVGSSKSFLGVTVHFIEANGVRKIESGNIAVFELLECCVDYTTHAILSILTKWDIDIDKVVAVVTNNESNIVSTVTQIFSQDKHIMCFAHTINLVAENSIKNCEGLYYLVNKVRSVVKFVKSSTELTNELYQYQINLGTSEDEIKKLILDANIKWNSTIYMIERFLEISNVIEKVLFTNDKVVFSNPEMPTADELKTLKEILDLLKPLEFVAQECSTENYIKVSKIIPLIKCTILEYQNTLNTKLTMALSANLKVTILAELEKWFGQIEFDNLISIATILDPRFKTVHFWNEKALANATCLLRDMINKLSSSSDELDVNSQEVTNYNLWIHHKFLTYKEGDTPPKDELSSYLVSPLVSLKDDPLKTWESMKMLYPTLYILATKYLSIVATSIPAERLFSKTGIAAVQSRNRLAGKRLNKLLFLNSVNQEYWF